MVNMIRFAAFVVVAMILVSIGRGIIGAAETARANRDARIDAAFGQTR